MTRKKLGTTELLAILAVAGITTASAATLAENTVKNARAASLSVTDRERISTASTGKRSGCSKSSGCGGKTGGCSKCIPSRCGYKYYLKDELKHKQKHHTSQMRRYRDRAAARGARPLDSKRKRASKKAA